MAYWCDDAGLRREQRRLDAQQQRAKELIRFRDEATKASPQSGKGE